MALKILYAAYFIFYLGFWFHRSESPIWQGYSAKYLFFLAIGSLPLSLPFIWKKIPEFNFRKWSLTLLATAFFFLFSTLLFDTLFLKIPFDPFLSIKTPHFTDQQKQGVKNDFKILILGSSTSVRYPPVLKSKLENYLNRPVTMFNASHMTLSIKHGLIQYSTEFNDIEADLVIVCYGLQALMRSFVPYKIGHGSYQSDWSHFYGEAYRALNRQNKINQLFEKYAEPFSEAWMSNIRFRYIDFPPSKYQSFPMYKKHLHSLLNYLKADKRNVLVLSENFLWKESMNTQETRISWIARFLGENDGPFFRNIPSFKSLKHAIMSFNQATERITLKKNIPYFDTEKHIPKTVAYFKDDVHLTSKGTEHLAELIFQKIISSSN